MSLQDSDFIPVESFDDFTVLASDQEAEMCQTVVKSSQSARRVELNPTH